MTFADLQPGDLFKFANPEHGDDPSTDPDVYRKVNEGGCVDAVNGSIHGDVDADYPVVKLPTFKINPGC
jgi:hypothetical protein